jgi:hypothetical protein
MFKRVYVVWDKEPERIVTEFENIESMESAPLISLIRDNEITVEEYYDNTFIKCYEYHDPLKSTEGSIMTSAEITKYEINIYLNFSREHGQMNKERLLSDNESPAHALVYIGYTNNMIGELNITGPCPKTKNDVKEYRKPINIESSKFNSYRKNILEWANEEIRTLNNITKKYEMITKWVAMQNKWENNVKTDMNK